MLTVHVEVHIDNIPQVWHLLAGESAYPRIAGQVAITTNMLGSRLHNNHTVYVPAENVLPDMVLSSYIHAGGFQEEQTGRHDWFHYTSTKCAIPDDMEEQTNMFYGMALL